ncbi:YfbU family protein [Paraburkholderia tropica]|uniref:YfbU family protein n=1 Tax=Paraburkholderia tropica TaxID=92647 RepID=UPI00161E6CB2|nr:YfbU family protein [Paraburkholderia tropica]MBB2977667.1 hypothetical protein [Paraburkholderia tropica]
MDEAQRLILANQYRILALLEPDCAADHELNAEAIENNYAPEIATLTGANRGGRLTAEQCDEVMRTLGMFTHIDVSMRKLSSAERGELESFHRKRFQGYDGNNEGEHLGYVRHLIEGRRQYVWILETTPDLNSRMPTVDLYRDMYARYRHHPIGVPLSCAEIKAICAPD